MWPRDGCLNQRSFCFYAEMWALGSAQLCSTAFVSLPTSPSPFFFLLFFGISILFSSICLTPLSFNTLSLLKFPPFASSLMLFCLLTHPFFPLFSLIFLSLLVILIRAFFFTPFPLSALVFVSPLPPLRPCCLPLSVPAGGRGPLGAAPAAQGQLLAGGDEAG